MTPLPIVIDKKPLAITGTLNTNEAHLILAKVDQQLPNVKYGLFQDMHQVMFRCYLMRLEREQEDDLPNYAIMATIAQNSVNKNSGIKNAYGFKT